MGHYIDFKSGVQHHIRNKFLAANNNNLPEAESCATYLADELTDFIRYCFDNFGERYKNYNMSSMFDVHLCAGRIMAKHAIQQEEIPLSQIENDVLASLRETQAMHNLYQGT